ncbi:MAG: hypothetical protein C3F13_13155 [Anaerolineales bacterium]|nr:hypothetical protein [Anaerolineae bacterium]PWB51387.1 MAG: hypothetical protein C3F13_13155 [Anaerolineales bacterium]
MKSKRTNQTNTYCIQVKEKLDLHIMNSFGDITLTSLDDGRTLLVGPYVDQSALRGLLDQLWNLNITIISVEKIENENQQATRIFEQGQGET